jgi:hypothetical protein
LGGTSPSVTGGRRARKGILVSGLSDVGAQQFLDNDARRRPDAVSAPGGAGRKRDFDAASIVNADTFGARVVLSAHSETVVADTNWV